MYNAASSVDILINHAFIIQKIDLGTESYWNINDTLMLGANFKENFPDFLLPEGAVIFNKAVDQRQSDEGAFFSEISNKWIYLKVSCDNHIYSIHFYDIVELSSVFVKLTTYLNDPAFISSNEDCSKAILLAQEEERLRIAETLHNEVGQLLTVAHLKVDDHSVQQTKLLLKEAIDRVRSLSFELSPTILKDFGLEGALRDMIGRKLENHHIACTLTFDLPNRSLGKYMDIAIFRIIQELLNNTIKHAKATEVEIQLTSSVKGIFVTVNDNGLNHAIHRSAKETNGFGLKNIMDRVRLLEGEFNLTHGKIQGTTAFIFIPLERFAETS